METDNGERVLSTLHHGWHIWLYIRSHRTIDIGYQSGYDTSSLMVFCNHAKRRSLKGRIWVERCERENRSTLPFNPIQVLDFSQKLGVVHYKLQRCMIFRVQRGSLKGERGGRNSFLVVWVFFFFFLFCER